MTQNSNQGGGPALIQKIIEFPWKRAYPVK